MSQLSGSKRGHRENSGVKASFRVLTDYLDVAPKDSESKRPNSITTLPMETRQKARSHSSGSIGSETNSSLCSPMEKKIRGDTPDSLSEGSFFLTILEKLDAMEERLGQRIDSIQGRFLEIDHKLDSLTENQTKTQEQVDACNLEINILKDNYAVLTSEISHLKESIVDSQARSMRNSLVFYGLPEKIEKGNPSNFVKQFAKEVLEIPDELDIHIERAHRGSKASNNDKARSRPLFVAFQRYSDRTLILQRARKLLKTKQLSHNGEKYSLFIDEMLPQPIREKRKAKLETRKELQRQHPSWRVYFKYPAILCYRDGPNGREVMYDKS